MLTEPGGGVVAGEADGGLVFLSYSHRDTVWAQRFRVLLKPLVRRERLTLWDDTGIRATEEWHPAIERAIARSRVALLLVSADFLDSDYIMERELPALLERGVGLAPVLVGACFWKEVPELAAVQFLHDAGSGGALALYADQPGERDRLMYQVCERLLPVVPEPAPAGLADSARMSRRSRSAGPVDPTPEGNVLGPLSRVPPPPPGYVVRDELDAMVVAVVGTASDGAVGLTGEPSGVGLHGRGGIGKSVLAAALAADDRIRRCFPDGVYWVTVGERPDLLGRQLDLLARLGAPSEARTIGQAAGALRTALAERRVLLVVDDVWSDAAAQAFRVTGRRGRLLYTSRDEDVVRATGAAVHRVEVLSPAAARVLAAAVLRVPVASLPDAADRALATVGRVPLAVALLAAAVRGGSAVDAAARGRSVGLDKWEQVAAALARDADVYGTHPYAATFRALHVATATLPVDLQAALSGLAVFPPDTAIPVAAIARYWAHTRGADGLETEADLDRLAAAKVLQRTDDTVTFHDLAHDYLVLHADALPLLHAELLLAFAALLDEAGQWWQLPQDEPYIWEHLAAHLAGAGDRSVLVSTATDAAYQARRIGRDGPHAGEADLAVAARLRPGDPAIAWWRSWLGRHAHLLGGEPPTDDPAAHPARIVATMLAWLEADSTRPDPAGAQRLAPLLARPHVAVHGLVPPMRALVRVLVGHTGSVRAACWSPDGAWIATAGTDGAVRLWSRDTGATKIVLLGRTALWALDWSPDGAWIAGGDDDGVVRVADARTGRTTALLDTRIFPVWTVAWSPDGRRLAVGGGAGAIEIRDSTTGAVVAELVGHEGRVRAIAWSQDGARLASTGDDRTIRLWRVRDGHCVVVPTGHDGPVWELEPSVDGGRLATGGDSNEVRLWDADTGAALTTLGGHLGYIRAIAWSPGGLLATAGDDGQIRISDPVVGSSPVVLTRMASWVYALAWSPDGTALLSGHNDGQVRLWNPTVGSNADEDGHDDRINVVAWSPDGTVLATGGEDGTVRLWDRTARQVVATLRGHTDSVGTVAWSPDGRLLAIGGVDGTVRLSDPSTGRSELIHADDTEVWAVAWSPDRTCLAIAAGKVHLWDTTARRVRCTLPETGWALAWSPDGTRLATAFVDVRMWEPLSGTRVAVLRETRDPLDPLLRFAWSPDGARLAVLVDRTIELWDPTAGRMVGRLDGHDAALRTVAWSPDGDLAVADAVGTVVLRDEEGRWRGAVTLDRITSLSWSDTALAAGQWGRPALLTLRDPDDVSPS